MGKLEQVIEKIRCREKKTESILWNVTLLEKRKNNGQTVKAKGAQWGCGTDNWVRKWPKFRESKLIGFVNGICSWEVFLVTAGFNLDYRVHSNSSQNTIDLWGARIRLILVLKSSITYFELKTILQNLHPD